MYSLCEQNWIAGNNINLDRLYIECDDNKIL